MIEILASAAMAALELKGVTPGKTTYEETQTWPGQDRPRRELFCSDEPPAQGYDVCSIRNWTTIGGKPVALAVMHSFDGMIAMVQFIIDDDAAAAVAAVLETKYGPAEKSIYSLQNGFGAKFQGVKHKWTQGDVRLELETIGSKVGEASVTIFSADYVERINRSKATDAKAVDDL